MVGIRERGIMSSLNGFKFLNGIKWICLLVFISGMANADLILDNAIVITDITGITVSPTTGNITISTASQNYTVTQGDPPAPNSVVINSFTASPTAITEGQSTTLAWTTSNATSCTASGGSGGWAGSAITLPSSSKTVSIASAGSYTFTLACAGTNGPVSKSLLVTVTTVVVNPPPQPGNCSNPALAGDIILWKALWGVDFPEPGYDTKTLPINRTGYSAVQFESGNIDDHGAIISLANTFTNGRRLGSISSCPGDFDVADECTHSWGSNGGIGWATDGSPGYCQMLPNTTYYMNFTFTDGFDPSTSRCNPGDNCIATIQHINLD